MYLFVTQSHGSRWCVEGDSTAAPNIARTLIGMDTQSNLTTAYVPQKVLVFILLPADNIWTSLKPPKIKKGTTSTQHLTTYIGMSFLWAEIHYIDNLSIYSINVRDKRQACAIETLLSCFSFTRYILCIRRRGGNTYCIETKIGHFHFPTS